MTGKLQTYQVTSLDDYAWNPDISDDLQDSSNLAFVPPSHDHNLIPPQYPPSVILEHGLYVPWQAFAVSHG
jgi:hypothetical protein